jgi:hydrogenase maturation protease
MTIPHDGNDPTVSIIGLGNVFLGDDGFGPLAVETFRCQYECGSNVKVMDLGTPGLDLAPYLYGRKLVVIVDAVCADLSPGTLSVFCEDDFHNNRARLRISGHDPGLWDALAHLRLANRGPSELIVIGAAPHSCSYGERIGKHMLIAASAAAKSIAQMLTYRGHRCARRCPASKPNLWWMPVAPVRAGVSKIEQYRSQAEG